MIYNTKYTISEIAFVLSGSLSTWIRLPLLCLCEIKREIKISRWVLSQWQGSIWVGTRKPRYSASFTQLTLWKLGVITREIHFELTTYRESNWPKSDVVNFLSNECVHEVFLFSQFFLFIYLYLIVVFYSILCRLVIMRLRAFKTTFWQNCGASALTGRFLVSSLWITHILSQLYITHNV